jgi:hypothetical protein
MAFVPTPPGSLPSPDAILARLERGPGEPADGYITPDDLRFAWQAYLSALSHLSGVVPPATDGLDEFGSAIKRGDVLTIKQPGSPPVWGAELRELILHLGDVSHVGGQGGLEAVLLDIVTRLHALEDATPTVPGPTFPSPEGALEIDNYSSGFVRVRDTGNLLGDGAIHPVYFKVAATPGPGGAVYPTANDIPSSTNPVWFDVGGTLGYVDTKAGAHVTQTGLKNWAKYGDPTTANHYVVYVRKTVAADDGSKPLLVVEGSVTVADAEAP